MAARKIVTADPSLRYITKQVLPLTEWKEGLKSLWLDCNGCILVKGDAKECLNPVANVAKLIMVSCPFGLSEQGARTTLLRRL